MTHRQERRGRGEFRIAEKIGLFLGVLCALGGDPELADQNTVAATYAQKKSRAMGLKVRDKLPLLIDHTPGQLFHFTPSCQTIFTAATPPFGYSILS